MSMFTPPGMGAHKPVRRGRRRSRLPLLLAVLAIVVIAAAGWWWSGRGDPTVQAQPQLHHGCPTPTPLPRAVAIHLVHVNVYNATNRRGLATEVAVTLRHRGFHVGTVDNDPLHRTVSGVAEVRTGPHGTGAARTVAAQAGAAPGVAVVPDGRVGTAVDLVIGNAFRSLRSLTAAAAALTPSPQPSPSTC
jgi:LytR cell envelope-related transcriptional attenuator